MQMPASRAARELVAPIRLTRAPSSTLRSLDRRLRGAHSVGEVYELGLSTLRCLCPEGHPGLLTVDAESLDWPHPRDAGLVWPPRSARPAWSGAIPLALAAPTSDLIKTSAHPTSGHDPLTQMLRQRLDLPHAVIGRVRQNGHVVALLVTAAAPAQASTPTGGEAVDHVADLMSTHLDRIVDAFLACRAGASTRDVFPRRG